MEGDADVEEMVENEHQSRMEVDSRAELNAAWAID